MVTPLSTYRLQLRPGFGFDETSAVADYLADLGVTHAYLSPILQAAPGSTHGYDVVDHSKVNEELGGEAGFDRLGQALGRAGLGVVLDIVPNHMSIPGPQNRWWWDVLENGPASVYASYFDVDWRPPEAKLRNTVLMPILGDHYGRVLEAGDISLVRVGGRFELRYFDHRLPVAPPSLDALLAAAAAARGAGGSPSDELESLASAFGHLPPATAVDTESVRERHRDKEILADRLGHMLEVQPDVASAVDAEVENLNRDTDRLDALLERQNYRLAFWRVAGAELDYRRFFDITTLVGLRVEDPQVFADTHRLVLGWLAEGRLDGLRIDHVDGLRDPLGYLARVDEASDGCWVVVEKILEAGEHLRAWPCAGTTGYEALASIGAVLVDARGEPGLTAAWESFTGGTADVDHAVYDSKRAVLRGPLAADVARLTELLVAVCERHRRYRDYTRREQRAVLEEVMACFSVYRTYVDADRGVADPDDVAWVEAATALAAERRPGIDADLLGFLAGLLVLRVPCDGPAGPEAELVMRFQQTTGPVMAKAVEDTVFYTQTRLASLNEVGGDAGRFGGEVADLHAGNAERQARFPTSMVTTSTHDTKRSEDVRARLALLSEVPERFGELCRRWSAVNEQHRVNGLPGPDAEWLLYQTLVGAWPLDADRAAAYMTKATKEAKVHTSWTEPDADYDEAVVAFTRAVCGDAVFQSDLAAFVAPLVRPGWVNALTQTLLRLTVPGVADTYQGQELWDLSLVDPDNRRPVDFDRRRQLLASLAEHTAADAWADADLVAAGLPKLAVTAAGLRLRRRHPDWFGAAGGYAGLATLGAAADHVVAFTRSPGGPGTPPARCAVVVPRLPLSLEEAGGWKDTVVELPEGTWTNALDATSCSGGEAAVNDLLGAFPVALLVQE